MYLKYNNVFIHLFNVKTKELPENENAFTNNGVLQATHKPLGNRDTDTVSNNN